MMEQLSTATERVRKESHEEIADLRKTLADSLRGWPVGWIGALLAAGGLVLFILS
jgi:hypothetical protein